MGCIVNETEWIQQPFAILLFSNSDVNLVFPTSIDLKLEFLQYRKSRKYTGYVPNIMYKGFARFERSGSRKNLAKVIAPCRSHLQGLSQGR